MFNKSIKIRKKCTIEDMVSCLFLILPYALILNTILFANARIFGIGIVNFLVDIVIFWGLIDSLLRPSKYKHRVYVIPFCATFLILNLLKMLCTHNTISMFYEWFSDNQYYYFLPFVFLLLGNKDINHNAIAKSIVAGSCFVCPLSIYMFVTSRYWGMVSQQDLLVYDIVGVPFARMFSIFGSPNVAGTYFCLVIVYCYCVYGFSKIQIKLLVILNLLCLILTFSKGSMLALIFAFLYNYLYGEKKRDTKKYIRIIVIIAAFLGGIFFLSSRGVYFWQKSEIFNNVRLIKWEAGLRAIVDNWAIGNDFSQHIYSVNTWESTLSDNSFLIYMGYFGIPFFIFTSIMIVVILKNIGQNKRRLISLALIVAVVLCVVYDFVLMYPVNYMCIELIIYMYHRENVYGSNHKELA